MNQEVSQDRRYYLSEFSLYNGDAWITFNIVGICTVKNEITAAVSSEGKVSVCSYNLESDTDGRLYFEYGVMCDKIAVDDFEHIKEA